ncbi:MAG: hypothetical protein J4G05_02400 [Chlorobi bacterium]|nr:hypothetical protein [Chlorobiota bacterium]
MMKQTPDSSTLVPRPLDSRLFDSRLEELRHVSLPLKWSLRYEFFFWGTLQINTSQVLPIK